MYFIFEILGTIAFAISGAMAGVRKKMDILGIVVLGMTTAVGGGIIRDLIIGVVPPVAFQKPVYAMTALIVSLIVFIPFVRNRINTDGKILNLIDAIGLGVFTVIGAKSGLSFNNPLLKVFLGVLSGVGGGVLRDVFSCEKPMIFVRHFYAVASIAGAILFLAMYPLGENIAMISGILLVSILRVLAARYKWHLPKA